MIRDIQNIDDDIIRKKRITAAGCILPLTNNNNISSQLGTRHRAAIGMSETSDSVTIVVSEETGAISYASRGELKRDITKEQCRESTALYILFILLSINHFFSKVNLSTKLFLFSSLLYNS